MNKWTAKALSKVNSDPHRNVGYFVRTGCLLTADGTDDDKVKPEGTTAYSFANDGGEAVELDEVKEQEAVGAIEDAAAGVAAVAAAAEAARRDVEVRRRADEDVAQEEEVDADDGQVDVCGDGIAEVFDDEDDENDGDVPATLAEALPAGFVRTLNCPTINRDLVSHYVLFHWTVVGWCFGRVSKFMRKGKFNFEVRYEANSQVFSHLLRTETYSVQPNAPIGSWCIVTSSSSDVSTS
jgi:hypothetical protein